jgi:hypothetical protein
MKNNTKVIDGFIWRILSEEEAIHMFESGEYDLYLLYGDGSEALIYSREELSGALERGMDVAIEVGFHY